jgi:hypothetical protein
LADTTQYEKNHDSAAQQLYAITALAIPLASIVCINAAMAYNLFPNADDGRPSHNRPNESIDEFTTCFSFKSRSA